MPQIYNGIVLKYRSEDLVQQENCIHERRNIMRKLTAAEAKKVIGGGLNWQCRVCGAKGWGILSSFMHNMIPGHHSFKTW